MLSGLGVTGVVRTVVALAFMTFVPGWAVLDQLDLAAPPPRAALAVALSFAICSAGALAMVWLGQWRPQILLDVLGALSLAAILVHLARELRDRAP